MELKDLLFSGMYYNHKLAEEYRKRRNADSPSITLLIHDLTWTGEKRQGSIEKRLGLEFENISPDNFIKKSRKVDGYIFYRNSKQEKLDEIKQGLTHFGLKENPSLEEYLEAGKKALNELSLYYVTFPTEKVKAYMNVAEDQQKTFTVNPYDLAVSHLAEQAMREFLIEDKKEFIARAFLYHNSFKQQEEKDITIFINQEQKSLGVRCQKDFAGVYLYPKKRVFEYRNKIADYIVFFNHFAHHLFYITGIVEKDFLSKPKSSSTTESPMEEFPFPEAVNIEGFTHNYKISVNDRTEADIRIDIIDKLKKRLDYNTFMNMLDSH
ncbi:hypothetical protein KY342_03480 [Candidatus Woesearchaeota archaeon]|nr:hypothetical protein [Candidatus Woesearchaeota archaeon]